MEDMEHVMAVQDAVDRLNDAVIMAARAGLVVEHSIYEFEVMGEVNRPRIETTIARRLERQSS